MEPLELAWRGVSELRLRERLQHLGPGGALSWKPVTSGVSLGSGPIRKKSPGSTLGWRRQEEMGRVSSRFLCKWPEGI